MDDKQDIFGKIDALFEKRVGFGSQDPRGRVTDDFPLLTEVVSPGQRPAVEERRVADRRKTDRRQGDRRHDASGHDARSFNDEQFARFLLVFEHKLEDLFIRQQLRMEESLRQVLRDCRNGPGDHPGSD